MNSRPSLASFRLYNDEPVFSSSAYHYSKSYSFSWMSLRGASSFQLVNKHVPPWLIAVVSLCRLQLSFPTKRPTRPPIPSNAPVCGTISVPRTRRHSWVTRARASSHQERQYRFDKRARRHDQATKRFGEQHETHQGGWFSTLSVPVSCRMKWQANYQFLRFPL